MSFLDTLFLITVILWLLTLAGLSGYYYGQWKHRQMYGKYKILIRQSQKPQKFTLSRILGKFTG